MEKYEVEYLDAEHETTVVKVTGKKNLFSLMAALDNNPTVLRFKTKTLKTTIKRFNKWKRNSGINRHTTRLVN